MEREDGRIPVLYLAPWVDIGGSDKGTCDWFRWLDRERFAPSLVTTQPSSNRLLARVVPFAEEVWPLPDLMIGDDFPRFILSFIHTRHVRIVHVMNSRLGYNLLPDIVTLLGAPRIVVQLHVEEPDRSGYVRYVATRYGNLVDAFSLSSHHLARAVQGYEVPVAKCRVIPTGVDTEQEFSPDRVRPVAGLDLGPLHILFPGRLVEQKDPLLMVEVARRLRDRDVDFRIHVVGEGHLEHEVREAIGSNGLESLILMHGPSHEIASWFSACDLLLLTSAFEGVPYTVYEAMAMALPAVVPALPGNVELLGTACPTLVTDRDDAESYASTIARLARDPRTRDRLGAAARERVRESFSLPGMARGHERLYDELLGRPSASDGEAGGSCVKLPPAPAPLRLRNRPSSGAPLVSVIVPCHNDGRYLPTCLTSIRTQTYPALEIVVVDDGSTDPETCELLAQLDHDPEITLLRLPSNRGPAAARNVALEHIRGSYVLPVDADNLLERDAIANLVEQLNGAGEQIGFIYPNLQFFGNRRDYFEAPTFNLYALLQHNYCDTCSLVDREVFDAGLRYWDEVKLGHEDWEFALSLAAREVYGEPAVRKTLRYRKQGFTRSDRVAQAGDEFLRHLRGRFPWFYDTPGRYGRTASVKARSSPALSVLILEPVEPNSASGRRLRATLARQRCVDAEILVCSETLWPPTTTGTHLRRLPDAVGASPAEILSGGLDAARGRYLCVTYGVGTELFADPGFVEKVLRAFKSKPEVAVIAFVDSREEGRYPWQLLDTEDHESLTPHTAAVRVDLLDGLPELAAREAHPVPSIVMAHGAVGLSGQWRHLPRRLIPRNEGPRRPTSLRGWRSTRENDRRERDMRLNAPASLPELAGPRAPWFMGGLPWSPPGTIMLCRHRHLEEPRWVVTNHRKSPGGYFLEFDLGNINRFPLPGTVTLLSSSANGAQRFATTEPYEGVPEPALKLTRGDDERVLGFLECAPLPLLDSVHLARHRATGQTVLISGTSDPLLPEVDLEVALGFIEPYPIHPRRPPADEHDYGMVSLMRTVDRVHRRHAYELARDPDQHAGIELGRLHTEPLVGSVAVRLSPDGTAGIEGDDRDLPRPTLQGAARWTAAPLRWMDVSDIPARVRAVAWRAGESARHLRRSPQEVSRGPVVGYLFGDGAPGRVPLWSSTHPVTGDHLLTPSRIEAQDMGYLPAAQVGYMARPLSDEAHERRLEVLWASRFGLKARRT
jgi:glycosyltransferase involved in cell wall biosynthesis